MTTTSRSTTMLATLAAAIGLVLPGCGDDEPSGPTKAEFVQRGAGQPRQGLRGNSGVGSKTVSLRRVSLLKG